MIVLAGINPAKWTDIRLLTGLAINGLQYPFQPVGRIQPSKPRFLRN